MSPHLHAAAPVPPCRLGLGQLDLAGRRAKVLPKGGILAWDTGAGRGFLFGAIAVVDGQVEARRPDGLESAPATRKAA